MLDSDFLLKMLLTDFFSANIFLYTSKTKVDFEITRSISLVLKWFVVGLGLYAFLIWDCLLKQEPPSFKCPILGSVI